MNRRHTRAETEAIIARLRATIPGLVLRTTFIVGFPGETEAEFEELLDYVEATRFERLGVFPYSFEPDTPAAKLPGHLPDEVKAERRDRIMAAQQPIAFAFNAGARRPDARRPDRRPGARGRRSLWVGRTYADAPDVDGVVYVAGRGPRAGRPRPLRDRRRPRATTWSPGPGLGPAPEAPSPAEAAEEAGVAVDHPELIRPIGPSRRSRRDEPTPRRPASMPSPRRRGSGTSRTR